MPMRIESPNDGTTRLSGVLRVRQRDFGIEPESKAGLVKVSNDVDLHFLLVVFVDRYNDARIQGSRLG